MSEYVGYDKQAAEGCNIVNGRNVTRNMTVLIDNADAVGAKSRGTGRVPSSR